MYTERENWAIRKLVQRVLSKIIYYKAQHCSVLNEAATILQIHEILKFWCALACVASNNNISYSLPTPILLSVPTPILLSVIARAYFYYHYHDDIAITSSISTPHLDYDHLPGHTQQHVVFNRRNP